MVVHLYLSSSPELLLRGFLSAVLVPFAHSIMTHQSSTCCYCTKFICLSLLVPLVLSLPRSCSLVLFPDFPSCSLLWSPSYISDSDGLRRNLPDTSREGNGEKEDARQSINGSPWLSCQICYSCWVASPLVWWDRSFPCTSFDVTTIWGAEPKV